MHAACGGGGVNLSSDELPRRAEEATGLPASLDEIRTLVFRAQGGDRTAAPQLRALFDRDPDRLIRLGGGDVAASVKALLVEKAAGAKEIFTKEAIARHLERMLDELAGPSPTPIERLLAERAALCWIELHGLDAQVVRRRSEEHTGRPIEALDRARDRAQRRYLAALRSLAQVRRLAVPVLMVNLARNQQINQTMSQDGPTTTRPD